MRLLSLWRLRDWPALSAPGGCLRAYRRPGPVRQIGMKRTWRPRNGRAQACPAVGPRDSGGLVVGQGNLVRAQLRGHFLRAGRGRRVSAPAGPAPSGRLGRLCAGHRETDGRRLRRDTLVPDLGIPRPGLIGRTGVSVPLAAPVYWPAVWTAPIPPAARRSRTPAARPARTSASPACSCHYGAGGRRRR